MNWLSLKYRSQPITSVHLMANLLDEPMHLSCLLSPIPTYVIAPSPLLLPCLCALLQPITHIINTNKTFVVSVTRDYTKSPILTNGRPTNQQ